MPHQHCSGCALCGVTVRTPSEVNVGASHGNTRARSAASGGAPQGTFAQSKCQSDVFRPGIASVVSGPPPRRPVRFPAPPAGAQAWNV